jgi:hypothetical protein
MKSDYRNKKGRPVGAAFAHFDAQTISFAAVLAAYCAVRT